MTEPPGGAGLRGVFVLADDDPRWKNGPVAQARAACDGGARAVQLRAKRSTDGETLAVAAAIRELTRARDVLFFVNDRFDLALAAGADGVHLGQDDVPPDAIPIDVRARLLVGRSTHTVEQARVAAALAVDYVAFGPVFGTASKDSPYSARGVAMLAEVVRLAGSRPVVAIGGIDAAGAGLAARAGAAGVAVISAVADAPDPVAATRALVRAFEAARP